MRCKLVRHSASESVVYENLGPLRQKILGHKNNVVPNIHKNCIALKGGVGESSYLMAATVIFITSNSSWLGVQAAANVMIVTNVPIALHHKRDFFESNQALKKRDSDV